MLGNIVILYKFTIVNAELPIQRMLRTARREFGDPKDASHTVFTQSGMLLHRMHNNSTLKN